MPEVVKTFIDHKEVANSYEKVKDKLKDIYDNYLSDMQFYQVSNESMLKSRMIYKKIYTQLNKENKNFKFSQIDGKMKSRDLESPIEWLIITNMVNKSCLLKERVSLPLIEGDGSIFRLYLSDMGLFTYQSGLNARNFVFDKENTFSEIFFENYISIELVARGYPLFYWKGKRNSELEFIIDLDGKAIPIDAKKSKGSIYSIAEYRNHNKNTMVIKVSSNHYGYNKETNVLTIPYYYISLFLNDIKK